MTSYNKAKKSLGAVWIGSALSIALLIIFFLMQFYQSSALGLPIQYLIVALVPLLVGILVSGYITELKAGNFGVSLSSTNALLSESEVIPDSGGTGGSKSVVAVPSDDWRQERAKEYERKRGYMLAHVYKPSDMEGQKFDISIFVVRHRKGTLTPPSRNLEEIKSAEFFFGDAWGNRTFTVRGKNGFFAVRTHAWGTFLAMCRLTFHDPKCEPINLFRYVDFSMADSVAVVEQ